MRPRMRLKEGLTRAADQHADYLRQIQRPHDPERFIKDPAFRTVNRKFQEDLQGLPHGPPSSGVLRQLSDFQTSTQGELDSCQIPGFGQLNVWHEDFWKFQPVGFSACVLPMPRSFLPHKGLALEILERGGKAFTQKAWEYVVNHLNGEPQIGDVIPIVNEQGGPYSIYLLVVLPYFWEGSSNEAFHRLRFATNQVYAQAQHLEVDHLVMPLISHGLFGYSEYRSAEILVDSAFESLFNVSGSTVQGPLSKVSFVDFDLKNAQTFQQALYQLRSQWIPADRVTTAENFIAKQDQRLMSLTWKEYRQTLRINRVKFKRSHGIIRNRLKHFYRNIRPRVWRAKQVTQPPPLLVNQETGEPAVRQFKATPYFRREISHQLYPTKSSGFPLTRRNAKGQLVGKVETQSLRHNRQFKSGL